MGKLTEIHWKKKLSLLLKTKVSNLDKPWCLKSHPKGFRRLKDNFLDRWRMYIATWGGHFDHLSYISNTFFFHHLCFINWKWQNGKKQQFFYHLTVYRNFRHSGLLRPILAKYAQQVQHFVLWWKLKVQRIFETYLDAVKSLSHIFNFKWKT